MFKISLTVVKQTPEELKTRPVFLISLALSKNHSLIWVISCRIQFSFRFLIFFNQLWLNTLTSHKIVAHTEAKHNEHTTRSKLSLIFFSSIIFFFVLTSTCMKMNILEIHAVLSKCLPILKQ